MNVLLAIGRFLRLINDDSVTLSLTHLAVYVALGKVIFTPSSSMSDLGVLLVSLLNYIHKRHVGVNNVQTKLQTAHVARHA